MDSDDTANSKAIQAKLTRLEKKVNTLNTQLKKSKLTIKELNASLKERDEQILLLEQSLSSKPETVHTTNIIYDLLKSPESIQALPLKVKQQVEQAVISNTKHYVEQAQAAKDHYIKLTLDNVDQKLVTPAQKFYEQSRAMAIDLPIHWQNILQHKVIDPSMHQINTLLVYAEDFYQDNLKQILALIDQLYKTILLWIEEVKAIVKGEKPIDLSWFKDRMHGHHGGSSYA